MIENTAEIKTNGGGAPICITIQEPKDARQKGPRKWPITKINECVITSWDGTEKCREKGKGDP